MCMAIRSIIVFLFLSSLCTEGTQSPLREFLRSNATEFNGGAISGASDWNEVREYIQDLVVDNELHELVPSLKLITIYGDIQSGGIPAGRFGPYIVEEIERVGANAPVVVKPLSISWRNSICKYWSGKITFDQSVLRLLEKHPYTYIENLCITGIMFLSNMDEKEGYEQSLLAKFIANADWIRYQEFERLMKDKGLPPFVFVATAYPRLPVPSPGVAMDADGTVLVKKYASRLKEFSIRPDVELLLRAMTDGNSSNPLPSTLECMLRASAAIENNNYSRDYRSMLTRTLRGCQYIDASNIFERSVKKDLGAKTEGGDGGGLTDKVGMISGIKTAEWERVFDLIENRYNDYAHLGASEKKDILDAVVSYMILCVSATERNKALAAITGELNLIPAISGDYQAKPSSAAEEFIKSQSNGPPHQIPLTVEGLGANIADSLSKCLLSIEDSQLQKNILKGLSLRNDVPEEFFVYVLATSGSSTMRRIAGRKVVDNIVSLLRVPDDDRSAGP